MNIQVSIQCIISQQYFNTKWFDYINVRAIGDNKPMKCQIRNSLEGNFAYLTPHNQSRGLVAYRL